MNSLTVTDIVFKFLAGAGGVQLVYNSRHSLEPTLHSICMHAKGGQRNSLG